MKKSYLVLVIAIVLGFVVWIIERPDKSNISDFEPFKLYPNFDSEKVVSVEVRHLLSGAKISTDGNNGWVVSEIQTELSKELSSKDEQSNTNDNQISLETFKADSEKMQSVLEKLGELTAQALISTNPEKQSIYQIDKLGKEVKIFDSSNELLVDLLIGRNGPNMFSTYVKRSGENDVYLVSEHIGAMIPADLMSWRDKRIWNFDPAMISLIDIQKTGTEDFTVSKNSDGTWQLVKPKDIQLETKKVEEFVSKIKELNASRFALILKDTKTGFAKPSLKITIQTNEGINKTLLVGSEDQQGYIYARLEDNEKEIYLLDSSFPSKIPSDWKELVASSGKE